jgi:hypothetical protein
MADPERTLTLVVAVVPHKPETPTATVTVVMARPQPYRDRPQLTRAAAAVGGNLLQQRRVVLAVAVQVEHMAQTTLLA